MHVRSPGKLSRETCSIVTTKSFSLLLHVNSSVETSREISCTLPLKQHVSRDTFPPFPLPPPASVPPTPLRALHVGSGVKSYAATPSAFSLALGTPLVAQAMVFRKSDKDTGQ